MTRRIRKLAGALRATPRHEPVHFHSGPDGVPYACHDIQCPSPALAVDEP